MTSTMTQNKTAEQKFNQVFGALANKFVMTAGMEALLDETDNPMKDYLYAAIENDGNAHNMAVMESIRKNGDNDSAKVEQGVKEISQGTFGTAAQQAQAETKMHIVRDNDVKASASVVEAPKKVTEAVEDKIVAKTEQPVVEQPKSEEQTAFEAVKAHDEAAEKMKAPHAYDVKAQKEVLQKWKENNFAGVTIVREPTTEMREKAVMFAQSRNSAVNKPEARVFTMRPQENQYKFAS